MRKVIEIDQQGVEDLFRDFKLDGDMFVSNDAIPYESFGIDAALALVIINWARWNPEGARLFLHESDQYRKKFSESLIGMMALYCADEIFGSMHKERVSKASVMENTEALLKGMYKGELKETDARNNAVTAQVNLVCVAQSKKYQYIAPFYSEYRQGAIRPPFDFTFLVSRILNMFPSRVRAAIGNDEDASAIGDIVYELFKNTDEHAIHDVLGNKYAKNFRGVLFRYRNVSNLPKMTGGNSAFAFYLTRVINELESRFVEISVFDGGPGLARQWLSYKLGRPVTSLSDFSYEDERDAVSQCFEKYLSSKDGSGYGMGLSRVDGILRKRNGFMKIRSGRLCLMKDFSSASPELKDWFDRRPILNEIDGTCFTICIPVSKK